MGKKYKKRSHSRSNSSSDKRNKRNRSRSRSNSQRHNKDKKDIKREKQETDNKANTIQLNDQKQSIENNSNMTEDELLSKIFGINDFDTSKNKSHVDTDLSAVFKGSQVKRKYRAYMNRRGGLNRALDKME